jgi:hypothetical protein
MELRPTQSRWNSRWRVIALLRFPSWWIFIALCALRCDRSAIFGNRVGTTETRFEVGRDPKMRSPLSSPVGFPVSALGGERLPNVGL